MLNNFTIKKQKNNLIISRETSHFQQPKHIPLTNNTETIITHKTKKQTVSRETFANKNNGLNYTKQKIKNENYSKDN